MDDELAMLEAAYDLSVDRHAALEAIATAAARAFGERHPLFAWEIPATCDFSGLHALQIVSRADPSVVERSLEVAADLPPGAARAALYADPCFWSVAERFAGTPAMAKARARGLPDGFTVHAAGGTGVGINIVTGAPGIDAWPALRRERWDLIAAHLGAAWRLRSALTAPAIIAELGVDGELRAMGPGVPASAREALRRAVKQREAARGRRRGTDRRHLWPALVAGRWTLVDAYTADGARYVVAHENPAAAAHLRALEPRERMVLDFALAGHASKWIALELGLSPATVTRLLQRALRRLGAASLAYLAGVQAAVFEPLDIEGVCLAVTALDAAVRMFGALTPAEIDVAKGALEGRSNAAIAAMHGKSARTVAHQLDAIYRKLGVSSRRELLTQLQ